MRAQEITELLTSGQVFLAYDMAEQALSEAPGDVHLQVLRALALAKSDALTAAVAAVEPIAADFADSQQPYQQAYGALQDIVTHFSGASKAAATELNAPVQHLVRAFERMRVQQGHSQRTAPEVIGLLAAVYAQAWLTLDRGIYLERMAALYALHFEASGDAQSAVYAISGAWLLQDKAQAAHLADQVIVSRGSRRANIPLSAAGHAGFWRAMALGLARLAGGEADAGCAALRQAALTADISVDTIAIAAKLLARLVDAKLPVDSDTIALFAPPTIAVFTGQSLAAGDEALMTTALETIVRREISACLDRMDVRIGYASAAYGPDLLFLEALIERGGEANIILPFQQDDFMRHKVSPGGRKWERRYLNALKLAHSVQFAVDSPFLGHQTLYRYGNQMLHGAATLRARTLETTPVLIAAWDMEEGSLTGGAAEFIDQWEDISRLAILDFGDMMSEADAAPKEPSPTPSGNSVAAESVTHPIRQIKAMLFADLVHFRRVSEAQMPAFIDFMERLQGFLETAAPKADLVNTWGDGFFVVMDTASDMAKFALKLQQGVRRFGGLGSGFTTPLSIRISLNAGPVFTGVDPFNNRPNFHGGEIVRTARLEPVTVPDQIYATEQYVALLTAEESQARLHALSEGQEWQSPVLTEFVGILSFAKNSGREPVYHVRPH